MKTNYGITSWVVGFVGCVSIVSGSAQSEGPYLDGFAGANFVSDTDVYLAGNRAGELEFDTGFRFDIGGGYNFTKDVSAGLEIGYLYNEFSDIPDAAYYQVPIMAVAGYAFHNASRVTPYAGAGIGAVIGILSDFPFIGTEATAAFGYQAEVGVNIEISERVELGVGYKFLGTTDQGYDDDLIEIDGTHSHSIGVNLKLVF